MRVSYFWHLSLKIAQISTSHAGIAATSIILKEVKIDVIRKAKRTQRTLVHQKTLHCGKVLAVDMKVSTLLRLNVVSFVKEKTMRKIYTGQIPWNSIFVSELQPIEIGK